MGVGPYTYSFYSDRISDESDVTLDQLNDELQHGNVRIRTVSYYGAEHETPLLITVVIHPSPDIQESVLSELTVHLPPVLSDIVNNYVPECVEQKGLQCLDGTIFQFDYPVGRFSRLEILPPSENIQIVCVLDPFFGDLS